MADVFNKVKRSEVMSQIRSKGNKNTELALIRLMRANGIIGWRRHQPVFGKPDFVFRTDRVAIFVDGCFWHGCPRHYQSPETNKSFWRKKLNANKKRDRLVTKTLKDKGWKVIRIWECQLQKSPSRCLQRIRKVCGEEKARVQTKKR